MKIYEKNGFYLLNNMKNIFDMERELLFFQYITYSTFDK